MGSPSHGADVYHPIAGQTLYQPVSDVKCISVKPCTQEMSVAPGHGGLGGVGYAASPGRNWTSECSAQLLAGEALQGGDGFAGGSVAQRRAWLLGPMTFSLYDLDHSMTLTTCRSSSEPASSHVSGGYLLRGLAKLTRLQRSGPHQARCKCLIRGVLTCMYVCIFQALLKYSTTVIECL